MKRKITLLISIALLTGLLTGCHGAKAVETFSMPDEFDESQKIEITF